MISRDNTSMPQSPPSRATREPLSTGQNDLSGQFPGLTLHDVIQHMQEFVVLVDRNSRIVDVNDVALEILGLPPGTRDVVLSPGMPNITDSSGTRIAHSALVRERALKGEQVKNVLQVYVDREGSRRYFMVNGCPILGADGEVDMALVVGREVTELERLLSRTEEIDDVIREGLSAREPWFIEVKTSLSAVLPAGT